LEDHEAERSGTATELRHFLAEPLTYSLSIPLEDSDLNRLLVASSIGALIFVLYF